MTESNPLWEQAVKRFKPLYNRKNDIRSEFFRDYNRILHSTAYRRLKFKTQVFFATKNDHLCTRIEHVNHVAAISKTIAGFIGLNTELTDAIAIGHDLGHAPFGHAGEKIIKEICQKTNLEPFWHEKNSLRFVDFFETLQDPEGCEQNLNLTYAVRDGIISHCGEVDEPYLYPRNKNIDLETLKSPSENAPYTWEGCVVKIADKIAYLGRDIEDAYISKILTFPQKPLIKLLRAYLGDVKREELNNTFIIHRFIINLCELSNPSDGIRFSPEYLNLMNEIKKFNYEYIYLHPRLENYKNYAALIINSIYDVLYSLYDSDHTISALEANLEFYPLMIIYFKEWLLKYSNLNDRSGKHNKYHNSVIYDLANESDYQQAIIDFISGMTDRFAIRIFEEITSF